VGSRRHRILIVEEDAGVRQLFRTVLALAGFDVETTADGLSALRSIDGARPDLVVLDLSVADCDGSTVLRELRSSRYTWSIPVVIVTGVEDEPAVSQAAGILRKPCSPEQLLRAVQAHLRAA
jgi:DNA-binding response OmpR family regulator